MQPERKSLSLIMIGYVAPRALCVETKRETLLFSILTIPAFCANLHKVCNYVDNPIIQGVKILDQQGVLLDVELS